MRTRARLDANHNEVVKALRQAGISAWSTAALGNGFPDVIAARCGVNILLEVKDGTKPPSERKLTDDEEGFFLTWKGAIKIVYSAEEAVKYVLANT